MGIGDWADSEASEKEKRKNCRIRRKGEGEAAKKVALTPLQIVILNHLG